MHLLLMSFPIDNPYLFSSRSHQPTIPYPKPLTTPTILAGSGISCLLCPYNDAPLSILLSSNAFPTLLSNNAASAKLSHVAANTATTTSSREKQKQRRWSLSNSPPSPRPPRPAVRSRQDIPQHRILSESLLPRRRRRAMMRLRLSRRGRRGRIPFVSPLLRRRKATQTTSVKMRTKRRTATDLNVPSGHQAPHPLPPHADLRASSRYSQQPVIPPPRHQAGGSGPRVPVPAQMSATRSDD